MMSPRTRLLLSLPRRALMMMMMLMGAVLMLWAAQGFTDAWASHLSDGDSSSRSVSWKFGSALTTMVFGGVCLGVAVRELILGIRPSLALLCLMIGLFWLHLLWIMLG